jgi:adenylate kinase family enzyme
MAGAGVMHEALLILGPTGSGKTPLGEHLARYGWAGRRCFHFDFGECLRRAASGAGSGFADDEIAFLQQVLTSGALLDDESFHLAERILREFLDACGTGPDDLLILNGLPRHVGQATALASLVAVRTVLRLHCSGEVVLERLQRNAGGDRGSRTDDDDALVREKLRTYERRTAPLAEHYRRRGAAVHDLQVAAATGPAELLARLA